MSGAELAVSDHQALALIDDMRRGVGQARTLPDVVAFVKKSGALSELVKAAGLSREAQNEAAALHVDCERRAGELLLELKLAGEYGPGTKSTTVVDLPPQTTTYRWQDMARVPDSWVSEYKAKQSDSATGEIVSAAIIKEGARLRREAEAAVVVEPAADAPVIATADAREWLPRQEPCDLLITDPPYATDVADIDKFAESWLSRALGRVKPSGRAFIFIGAYPDELRAYLPLLKRDGWGEQVLAWYYPDTLGPSPTHAFKSVWQAILYTWGPEAPPLNGETLTERTTLQQFNMNSGIDGGRQHQWQKPDRLAERIISLGSDPGATILDPFAGTGTFLLAAQRLGRIAKGCELDPDMIEIAVRRGCRRE